MFEEFQTLENPALRAFLKLDKSVHGIVVHKPGSPDASYPLKEWDVITKIGDTPVDDEGMIKSAKPARALHLPGAKNRPGREGPPDHRPGRAGMHVDLPVQPKFPMVLTSLRGLTPPISSMVRWCFRRPRANSSRA